MKKVFIVFLGVTLVFLMTNISALVYRGASFLYQYQKYDMSQKIFSFGEKIDSNHIFEYQYNLGNVWYKISTTTTGSVKTSGENQALKHYNQALQVRPNDVFTKENIEFILKQRQKTSTQSGSEANSQNQNNSFGSSQIASGSTHGEGGDHQESSSLTGTQNQENTSMEPQANTGSSSSSSKSSPSISEQEAYELEKKMQELQTTANDFEGEFGKQQYGDKYISPFESFFQNESNSPERDW